LLWIELCPVKIQTLLCCFCHSTPKVEYTASKAVLFDYSQSLEIKAIRQEEEIKGVQIGKEEAKLSLFADVILYLKDAKILHQKTVRRHKHF
jgi:hypothetical protein